MNNVRKSFTVIAVVVGVLALLSPLLVSVDKLEYFARVFLSLERTILSPVKHLSINVSLLDWVYDALVDNKLFSITPMYPLWAIVAFFSVSALVVARIIKIKNFREKTYVYFIRTAWTLVVGALTIISYKAVHTMIVSVDYYSLDMISLYIPNSFQPENNLWESFFNTIRINTMNAFGDQAGLWLSLVNLSTSTSLLISFSVTAITRAYVLILTVIFVPFLIAFHRSLNKRNVLSLWLRLFIPSLYINPLNMVIVACMSNLLRFTGDNSLLMLLTVVLCVIQIVVINNIYMKFVFLSFSEIKDMMVSNSPVQFRAKA